MNSFKSPQTSLSAELKDIITTRNMLTTRTRMKVLRALDEIQQENIENKQENLKAQAIHEIFTSEVSYLKQLETLMEYFMRPISEKTLLDPATYAILFENIETLYNINNALLTELKDNIENMAQAFHKLAPFFKLYSVYAYNYKRALHLLQNIQKSHPEVASFISGQESRPEVNQKLSALLITPIQRVPRYRLLIKEVLRFTSPRHKDYKILMESLNEIEKVAEHINDLIAEYENAQQIIELQSRISNSINLVKPGRKLIRQGPLMRVSRKKNASYRRHFILLSDILLYCKGDPEHSLTVCCLLPLSKCKVEKVLSNGLFKIICKQEVLLVYSQNGDSEEWIEALQNAVKKYIECRQTLRKDSSSRIPLRHVNRFTSDNRIDKRLKRRRIDEEDDPTIDCQNDSKIIYMSQDLETEGSSINRINCFPSIIKKAKKCHDDSKKEKPWKGVISPSLTGKQNNSNRGNLNKISGFINVNNSISISNEKDFSKRQSSTETSVCEYTSAASVLNNIRQCFSSMATTFKEFFIKR